MNTLDLRTTAWLTLAHVALMLTAGLILIIAFDFPDILRAPMETTLELFHRNRQWTVPAYYLFTLTGITTMGVVLLLYRSLDFQQSTTAFLAMVSGVLFGLTSSLGFVRWPFLMEHLATLTASAGPEQLEDIRLVYDAFHLYAGVSVGENFAFWFEAAWTFFFATAMLHRPGHFPRPFARSGQVIGLGMLVYSLEQFGGTFSVLGPVNMLVHTAQLGWLVALAFLLLNSGTARQGRLTLPQAVTSIGLFLVLAIVSFT